MRNRQTDKQTQAHAINVTPRSTVSMVAQKVTTVLLIYLLVAY